MPTQHLPHDPALTTAIRTLRRQIGRDLHSLRQRRRMPLHKLARLTGIPAARLDQVELGKGEVRLEEIVRVMWVLK